MSTEAEYVQPDPVDPTPPAGTQEPPAASEEAQTFDQVYVDNLRREAGEHRMKAKRVDEANARLAASYAASTGRLVDVDAFAYTEDLLGEDGVVDRDKVTAAVEQLVTAKPYLAARAPLAPITQGIQPEAPRAPGLFDLINAR